MKIKAIHINEGFFSREFEFTDNINLIYSLKNSVGKTTLLRLIFWGLGYEIPSTKKFNFNKCDTQIKLELDNLTQLTVCRFKDVLTVFDGTEEITYSLPMEAMQFHSRIFNTNNIDVVANILGAIYLDQEKGWTLLNRGCVIGKIPFNVESLIRGLSNIDCKDLIEEEKKLRKEISKYQKMLDIAEYQKQINEESGNLVYEEKNDELHIKIATLRLQQSQIEDELKRVSDIIKENDSFKNYIEKMRLIVVSKSGEEIPVNKSTIKGFEDVQQVALARKKVQLLKLQDIKNKISKLTQSFDDTETLVKVETLISSFDSKILSIPVNAVVVTNVIEQLAKRKREINNIIELKTKNNNPLIATIYKDAYAYLKELSVDKFADDGETYLFTHDLKSLSGAVLHLTVFAFRLAYIKAIENSIGISLPIVIDSPSGKEVQKENVEKMMDIIERDFPSNQVIIASIYQYDIDNLKTHTIEKSLMGEDFL